ncbi:head-tail adaptor [Salinihabitans flavidus]|uniref:Head-tail adaptor n=1 Tax=Salinihabitans flavidus TaxID=569882 RepID=A0A1H8Q8R8_9RHOB|nr:head-tail adaptor protein [Salinihabitans flavidus]SEO50632.1 head-tail adaptor [Salinihabitans flavidus]
MSPRLNRKLLLESAARVPDGAGGFSESWAARGTLWAEVTARSGRQRESGEAPVMRVPYRIVVRGAPHSGPQRPRPGDRFRDGARIYVIEAVAERDPEGRFLTCFAKEESVT